jgi:hypothetical protein
VVWSHKLSDLHLHLNFALCQGMGDEIRGNPAVQTSLLSRHAQFPLRLAILFPVGYLPVFHLSSQLFYLHYILPIIHQRFVDMAFKDGELSVAERPIGIADNGFKNPSLTAQDQADMAGVGKKQQFVVSTYMPPTRCKPSSNRSEEFRLPINAGYGILTL